MKPAIQWFMAFLLAACGFLAGRRATTHWLYADRLKSLYPDIEVDPQVLYIDEGQILTSAGSAAGVDLLLHIVRNDFGARAANEIARRMVMAPHREGGQAQFIARPVPRTIALNWRDISPTSSPSPRRRRGARPVPLS